MPVVSSSVPWALPPVGLCYGAAVVAVASLPPGQENYTQVLTERVGSDLLLAMFATEPPAGAEWKSYLAAASSLKANDKMLIFSVGGAPTALQRKEVEDSTREHEGPVAVVTTSRIARGVVTALRWMGSDNIKAFDPGGREQAFEYLGLSAEQSGRTLTRAKVLAKHLGVASKLFG